MVKRIALMAVQLVLAAVLAVMPVGLASAAEQSVQSPGHTTYVVDPVAGDDANPPGKPWRTFARVNALRLAPGDRVEAHPGVHACSLKPAGSGTEKEPVVFHFHPGVHTIACENAVQEPMFVSNSSDSPAPKPIAILVRDMKHVRFEGSEAKERPVIVAGGRMVQVWNDCSEDITYTNLAFDLKRPTVSEFLVLETAGTAAVIAVAEGSDYVIQDGRFRWTGDWGPGKACQEAVPSEGTCWRRNAPRGWQAAGQVEARATDLGVRKVRLEFPNGNSGLVTGHQYHFRNNYRERVGVHNSRSARITFQDCSVYALVGMGFVSQFTDTITYRRVDVMPPAGSGRTCAAWADIFQFSNCKGQVIVDGCRLSGMQDDAINCHGTHLRIMEATGPRQVVVRFMHGQTYGFAAFAPGDEVAVIGANNLREYAGNPRRRVTSVEKRNEREWLLTFDGPVPRWEKNDVLDNITWYPDLTATNNHVSVDPVRGFLITTRGKVLVEGNTFHRCHASGILVEDDASGWFESGPIRDLTIRNNTFIGCGIRVNPHANNIVKGEPVHENIRITGNHFENGGIDANGVGKLEISGNHSFSKALPVKIQPTCSDVTIENNTIDLKTTNK